jgi:putative ABC transport system ATP-binding protein
MQLAGMELEIQKKRVDELLDKVKLTERREHLPFQLSSGEQQRIGIARALANDPPIILADEPTANLDKKSSEIIADLFKNLNNEGKTIIVVTHDQRLLNYAYRIITMDDGKIIQDERIKEPSELEKESTKLIKIPEKLQKYFENKRDEEHSNLNKE